MSAPPDTASAAETKPTAAQVALSQYPGEVSASIEAQWEPPHGEVSLAPSSVKKLLNAKLQQLAGRQDAIDADAKKAIVRRCSVCFCA